MWQVPSQKNGKILNRVGLAVVAALAGCYQETPYPPCFLPDDPDPACHPGQAEEGAASETNIPTTGTQFPGDSSDSDGQDTGAGEATASSGESSSGESSSGTTGPWEQAEPVIVGMSLTPGPGTPGSCVLQSAGPVAVTVQVEDAAEVWITVDDGDPVALGVGDDDGTEFVGEIAVLGESWNGLHTVSAVAKNGELASAPWGDMFTVAAPAAGSEAWKKKSSITPSYGNAVAVDSQGDVYELFTESSNQGERCHVRRRDAQGEPVWQPETTQLAIGMYCIGEDIKVGPDGTVWALANITQAGVERWHLSQLDADGTLLDTLSGDYKEGGRGLDVNAAGDVLLCGVGPAFQGQDAWVRLAPSIGTGWTVPWVYKSGNFEFEERTKDCAFIEDRIVVVGEVFGKHDPNELDQMSRGFIVEYGLNGSQLPEMVATSLPAWQSGYEAIAPDGQGGYVTVGYTCNAKVVPCTQTEGVVKVFSLGAFPAWEQSVADAAIVRDVVPSTGGGVVIAAQALKKEKGFLVQAWSPGQNTPAWDYQGNTSTLQVATALALGPYGYLTAGGYYLDGNTLAAGVVRLHPY